MGINRKVEYGWSQPLQSFMVSLTSTWNSMLEKEAQHLARAVGGVLVCPLVDPCFNLFFLHVLVEVHVRWANGYGQAALVVEPGSELL